MFIRIKWIMLNILREYSYIFRKKTYNIDSDVAYKKITSIRENKYVDSEIINNEFNNIYVSIIIPVYNVEKFVEQCVDSVLNQKTNYSTEIILINDGSLDSSGKIIEKYRIYKNIKIIHQKNCGLSGARNTGLNVAVGKYVIFVDSDDILEADAVEKLVSNAEKFNADIVAGGYETFPNEMYRYTRKFSIIDKMDLSSRLSIPGYSWNKIYNRNLFKAIRFPQHLLFEDTISNFLLYELAEKVVIIPDIIYKYRINPKGIMGSLSTNTKCLDTYWVVEELLKKREYFNLECNLAFYKFLLFQLGPITYGRIKHLPNDIICAVFNLCCCIIQKNKPRQIELNRDQRLIEKAFLNKNYSLWKYCSKLNSYNNHLMNF